MSLPNIPDIKPDISLKRQDVIHLLLTSIAMEEISFSHILNAEAEKIQYMLSQKANSLKEILQVNESVERVLRGIVANQILLQFKFTDILKLEKGTETCEEDWEE
ncbi:hypothetical protein KIH86_16800 [Paenibacillus sp. HN-1]|uniref:hypothetical protein n=1 Tax=Paenibacillus TaxID=44249 RepID=UPI001CA8A909|nr:MULTISPECIES: hypothetical protein [Paenibacillus]MBY9081975.1 hypothetical protein [Paenibacillus sp. CGMCC 1.18879]MBY9085867.1 hypothetical protein [Paenibacillus sinensis]